MMTRRDYVAIARVIRAQHDSEGTPVLTSQKISMRKLAHGLCREFAAGNPRFDAERFMTAAVGE